MNDQQITDLPVVAFHGVQKVVTNLCQWLPVVAKMGESIQKYNHGIELTALELPAAS